uniref:Acyl-CoA-binding domain-containing protein 6 n=1 Tax=Rhabditophanes sp. KR3021 TaxID=114890 RepID=A0AC35U9M2_9BILA
MFMVHLMAFYGKFLPKNEETVTVDEEEEEVDSNLQSLFDKACAILPSYLNTTSTKDKLYLYGRYKFANDGPCDKKNKPSFYSVFGEKSKYDSWEEATAKCPTKSIAMKQYVYQIEKIIGKPIGEANVEGISKSLAHKPSVMVYEDTDHLPENASVNEKTFDLIVRHIRKNDVDGVKKLIEENSIMLHYIDENMGMSVFHIAVDQGSVPLCKMILKLGADINQVDNEGQTALEIGNSVSF